MTDNVVWVATALSVENEDVVVGAGRTAAAAEANLRKRLAQRCTEEEELGEWIAENWDLSPPYTIELEEV
jgi:hypothetical protein